MLHDLTILKPLHVAYVQLDWLSRVASLFKFHPLPFWRVGWTIFSNTTYTLLT